jgi:hypothetical protein
MRTISNRMQTLYNYNKVLKKHINNKKSTMIIICKQIKKIKKPKQYYF